MEAMILSGSKGNDEAVRAARNRPPSLVKRFLQILAIGRRTTVVSDVVCPESAGIFGHRL
jgi:hypothetical protein